MMMSRRESCAERRLPENVARHRLLDIQQFCRDRFQRGVAVEALDQRAKRCEIGILLVGVERDAVIMRQRGQFSADPDQPRRVGLGIAVELELEIAGTGVFVWIGDAALAFDLIVHADGMPDRDALQPLTPAKELRDVGLTEVGRQPRIDPGDILRHAVEEIHAKPAQQRIQDRLVDLGRPETGGERRDILASRRPRPAPR